VYGRRTDHWSAVYVLGTMDSHQAAKMAAVMVKGSHVEHVVGWVDDSLGWWLRGAGSNNNNNNSHKKKAIAAGRYGCDSAEPTVTGPYDHHFPGFEAS
jgi:hypothetical protein